MRGGKLHNVITIETPVSDTTGRGNETLVKWKKWRDAFADIANVRSKEFFERGQRYAETVYRFTCRYFDVLGVDATMRIKFEGQYYSIKSVQPGVQTRNETVIEATLIW